MHEAVHPGAMARFRADNAFEAALSDVCGALNVSTARLVGFIARALAEELWLAAGSRSPEHWVAGRCGVSWGRARRLVRIARRMHEFPRVEAMALGGQLTEDHLDVIVTHAHPAHDARLGCAPHMATPQLLRWIRHLPVPEPEPVPGDDASCDDDGAGDDDKDPAAAANVLSFGWGPEGRFGGRFDLDAKAGAVLEKALRQARSRVFAERTGADPEADGARVDEHVTWADALERLGHAGLGALDPGTASRQRPGERYQVLVHVDVDDPRAAHLHLGPLLTTAERDAILCDADLRAILWKSGQPVAKGRRKRVVDTILRALVEERDGGCAVDGCAATGFLHIHHIVEWALGGPTDLSNLVALCGYHHRQVHAGKLRILGTPGPNGQGLGFVTGDGRPLPHPSPSPTRALPDAPAYHGTARGERLTNAALSLCT